MYVFVGFENLNKIGFYHIFFSFSSSINFSFRSFPEISTVFYLIIQDFPVIRGSFLVFFVEASPGFFF